MSHDTHTPARSGFLFGFIMFIVTFIALISYVVGLNSATLPVQ